MEVSARAVAEFLTVPESVAQDIVRHDHLFAD
jgi:hypothetical protein